MSSVGRAFKSIERGGNGAQGGDIGARRQGPRNLRTQAGKALQAYWYGKLRRTKFDDDGKLDPNGTPFRDLDPGNHADRTGMLLMNADAGSTRDGRKFHRYVSFYSATDFDNINREDLERTLLENARTFGTETNLANTPTARAWQAVSRAANDLPPTYKHRLFLIDLAQTGCVAKFLLQRYKLGESAARGAFERFLAEHGMAHFRGLLVRGKVRPA